MMTQRFIIHSDLPDLNELIDARMIAAKARGRKGKQWNGYSVLKRDWMEYLVPLARSQLRPVTKPVRFRFIYFEPHRRRDPDNIAAGAKKFILDALVHAGIIANDGQRNVAGWSEEWHVSRSPRVEVFLEEGGVIEETIRIPIGPWVEMGRELAQRADEAGFDLTMNAMNASTAKGNSGPPAARYEGKENGMAVYTVYRWTGRREL